MSVSNSICPQFINDFKFLSKSDYETCQNAINGWSDRIGVCDRIKGVFYKAQQSIKHLLGQSDWQKARQIKAERVFIQKGLDDKSLKNKLAPYEKDLEDNKDRPYSYKATQKQIAEIKNQFKENRKAALTPEVYSNADQFLIDILKYQNLWKHALKETIGTLDKIKFQAVDLKNRAEESNKKEERQIQTIKNRLKDVLKGRANFKLPPEPVFEKEINNLVKEIETTNYSAYNAYFTLLEDY